MMTRVMESRFSVAYFDRWQHPAGERMLEEADAIELLRLQGGASVESNFEVLGRVNGYHVSSARDDVPPSFRVDGALLSRSPNLVAITTGGVGYDTVDVDACTGAGVLVANQAGGNRQAVAEHVLGMMLCLSKRIIEADRAMRRDRGWTRSDFMGGELAGKTIGIIGLGNIGGRVAELCRGLFGMHVVASDPYIAPEAFTRRGARSVDLEELLAVADFVSVNCPLTRETAGMIGPRELARMRPGSYFITTARGGIHDEAALAVALERGAIGGAGLDVWESEPPPLDHPLLRFDNVVVTPHTAGVTAESRRNVGTGAAEQWVLLAAGDRPPRLVNPEAWPRFRSRYGTLFG